VLFFSYFPEKKKKKKEKKKNNRCLQKRKTVRCNTLIKNKQRCYTLEKKTNRCKACYTLLRMIGRDMLQAGFNHTS